MSLIDFNAALAERQKREQFEHFKQQMADMLYEASEEERREIYDAIQAGDKIRYRNVTEPLIYRMVVRQINSRQEKKDG